MDKNPLLSRASVVVGKTGNTQTSKCVFCQEMTLVCMNKCSSEQMTHGTEGSSLGRPGARVFP